MCGIATATYQDNFPEAIVRTSKLESVRPKTLRDQIGEIDLLLASPECTNHTCAKGAGPRSEESRATAMQTLRFARAFEPEWIVMENVVHMKPWSRYPELKEKLRALGYAVEEFVFDASDFGVGQRRRRLFVVAHRYGEPPAIVPPRKRKAPTVKSLLDPRGAWPTSPLYKEGRSSATLERARRGFSAVGTEESFLVVYYGTDGSGGWQRIDKPLRTVTTVDRFALVEKVDGQHRMRMLQVPELKRAMGFGEDYKLQKGTRRDKIRILGNGVCPPVMEGIVGTLLNQKEL